MIPIYISECSPALIRGRLVGMFEVMLQIALVFGFWVNYGVSQNISGTSDKQWRIPVAIQFIPSGLLLCFMPWVNESPRWLVSKNRIAEARKSLSWVRNLPEDHEYIENEMNEIETNVAHELEISGGQGARWQLVRELFARGVRWRVAMAVLLMLLQNLTGINAINYYSPVLLKSIGYTGTEASLLATGVYGIVKMAAVVTSSKYSQIMQHDPADKSSAVYRRPIRTSSYLDYWCRGCIDRNVLSSRLLCYLRLFRSRYQVGWRQSCCFRHGLYLRYLPQSQLDGYSVDLRRRSPA